MKRPSFFLARLFARFAGFLSAILLSDPSICVGGEYFTYETSLSYTTSTSAQTFQNLATSYEVKDVNRYNCSAVLVEVKVPGDVSITCECKNYYSASACYLRAKIYKSNPSLSSSPSPSMEISDFRTGSFEIPYYDSPDHPYGRTYWVVVYNVAQYLTSYSGTFNASFDLVFHRTGESGGESGGGGGGGGITTYDVVFPASGGKKTAFEASAVSPNYVTGYEPPPDWLAVNWEINLEASTSTFTLSADANPYATLRTATVVFNLSNGGTKSVTVKQNAGPATSTVSVTFNSNGGSSCGAQQYTVGSTYGSLPSPTKTGYALEGWYSDSSLSTRIYTSTTVSSSVTTLYAKWTPITYTVSYDYDGGTKGSSSPSSGTFNTAFCVSAPSKTGSTFAGWTVSSGLDASTAKWGASSNPSTTISGSGAMCGNGASGNVYFTNLRSTSGSVTLKANWTQNASSISLGTALDNTSLSFTTGGNASWFGQAATSHDGVDAAESGDISDNQNTWLQTKVSGSGTISFWWKVSCESNADKTWDYLEFLVDDTRQGTIAGTGGSWEKASFTVSGSGTHTLKWNYRKDGSNSNGSDCGWVDQIVWTASAAPETVTVSFVSNGGTSCSSREYTVGSSYGSLPSPTKSGSSFIGWYSDQSLTTRVYTSSTVSSSVRTLYAKWGGPGFTIEDGVLKSVNPGEYTEIVIPDGVTSIGDNAFYSKRDIVSVVIPNGVTNIGNAAFALCERLESVSIPGSVRSIGEDAFISCSSLLSVAIPDSVTSIGEWAFDYCLDLAHATIGSGVTNLPRGVFCNCTNLTSVVMPSGVTSIGELAFGGCSKLAGVTIPSGVVDIGESAFAGCNSLSSIDIPRSVESIGSGAFRACKNLASVTIPDSARICGKLFFGCDSLAETRIEVCDLSRWSSAWATNGVNTLLGGERRFFFDNHEITEVAIPNGVSTIVNYSFEGCGRIESVSIPDTVTRIGEHAFSDCHRLNAVSFGKGVTSIGWQAFSNCRSLVSVVLPTGLTDIKGYAFDGCTGLGEVLLPDGLTNIGDGVFRYNFNLSSVTIPNSVTNLGHVVFGNCSNLVSIVIPDKVPCIGSYAFEYCPKLANVTIGKSVRNIFGGAFSHCDSLAQITIPDNVVEISGSAFAGCGSLSSIRIGKGVASIGGFAFVNCASLQELTIPDSVGSIGPDAFRRCERLTHIEIPDSVTNIADYVFSECISLTHIEIPDSVVELGDYAFSGCVGLTSLTLPAHFEGRTSNMGIPAKCSVVFSSAAKTCVVRFDANGGTGGWTKSLVCGSALAAPTVKRTGYAFAGWSPAVPATVPGQDATYVAKWTPTSYKVAFDANGGTLPKGKSMAAQTFARGTAVKLRANAFARSGHVFVGWAKSKTGAVAYKNAQSVKDLCAAGKTATLYAVWAKKTYKVAFYANGGKGKMAKQTFTYGKAKKLPANKFKAPKGKTFAGWAKSKADAKKGKVVFKDKQSVKDLDKNGKTVKLYAVWQGKNALDSALQPSNGTLRFATGGDAKWKVSKSTSKTGGSSAVSGSVKPGKTTWLRTTVSGPGKISFWCKSAGGNIFAECVFSVDGKKAGDWSGGGGSFCLYTSAGWNWLWADSSGWCKVSVAVKNPGTHVLEWRFERESFWKPEETSGTFWVDDVRWTPKK